MVIYTPLPLELVLDNYDQQRQFHEIEVSGMKMLVEAVSMSTWRLVRIFSTDPQDFLKPEYQPGVIISVDAFT